MRILEIIRSVSFGICLYAGCYHLIVGVRRRPLDRIHLFLALAALAFSSWNLCELIFHQAASDGRMGDYLFYLGQGFVVVIIVMSLRLSNAVISREKELANLNLALGQRVEDRTAELTLAHKELAQTKKSAEAALEEFEESEARLDYVLKSAGLAVWEYDLMTRETTTTDMFPYLLGYKPHEILVESDGKWRGYQLGHQSLAARLLNPDDKERYAESLGKMINGQETFEVEYRLRTADGRWKWIRDYGKIVKWDDSGNPLVAYGVLIDIDRMKTLQLALTNAKESAEAANRAKSVFLANMSHELRTPLNAILGHTQIMSKGGSLSSEQQHSIDAVHRSGDHLLMLINSVLEMSKIESGRVSLNPVPFSIDELVKDVDLLFSGKMNEKGLHWVIERHPSAMPTIIADRVKIRQILINLLSNGIRHTKNGVIILRLLVLGDPGHKRNLVVEVEDTGEGIAPENQEKIFDPFVQISGNSKNRTGTGLGLSISRQYAGLMGGDLTVESRLGKGSVFRFKMPIVETDSSFQDTRRIAGIGASARSYRVLVVDDEASNRDVLAQMLAPEGFQIQEAKGGREAIALFESWSPDLILMDIRMPDMDGTQAIQAIRVMNKGQDVSIVGVSASVFEEERQGVLKSGADDFLPKPINAEKLFGKICDLLGIEPVYETDSPFEKETAPIHIDNRLLRQRFNGLPKDLSEAIRAAAKGGYMDRVSELAAEVSHIDPELGKRLLQSAMNFDFDTIRQIIMPDSSDNEVENRGDAS